MRFLNIISTIFFFLYKKLLLEKENEMESNNRQKNFSIVPDFVELVNFFLNREAKGQNHCWHLAGFI